MHYTARLLLAVIQVNWQATFCLCPHLSRNNIKIRKNVRNLELFPAIDPLEAVCIDIHGEVILTPHGKKYLIFIVERFTKLS